MLPSSCSIRCFDLSRALLLLLPRTTHRCLLGYSRYPLERQEIIKPNTIHACGNVEQGSWILELLSDVGPHLYLLTSVSCWLSNSPISRLLILWFRKPVVCLQFDCTTSQEIDVFLVDPPFLYTTLSHFTRPIVLRTKYLLLDYKMAYMIFIYTHACWTTNTYTWHTQRTNYMLETYRVQTNGWFSWVWFISDKN